MWNFLRDVIIAIVISILVMAAVTSIYPRPVEQVIAFQEECDSKGGKFSVLPLDILICDLNK